MSEGWGSETRYSSAMAIMEEIPFRIGDDMQRIASYVVDNVQVEVAALSKQFRRESGRSAGGAGADAQSQTATSDADSVVAEKVVKNLEVIPTMVQNLLEDRVEKARAKVRRHVHGIMQSLTAIQEERDDHEELVNQMR